ncbi:hypothetical protein CY652_10085 [Burkholderia sp. WAC0059]|nr:hypothetical protein CY652_10085 [Burkholderia sp. WAC0059]
MLLPLPAAVAQTASLQNHLALETLRHGYGASTQVSFLFRAVFLTYLLRDRVKDCCGIETFRNAEAALYRCTRRAADDGVWLLPEADIHDLMLILAVHDRQLASVPTHAHDAARATVLRYATGNEPSPIPQADANIPAPGG